MQTRSLGPFRVSNICLGGMFFGSKTPVAESHRMLDRFLDAGGNFVDTADVYDNGGSERTLQPWLARNRDRFAVYDREGEVCRRCGGIIERIVQAGRSTYFCPDCQIG